MRKVKFAVMETNQDHLDLNQFRQTVKQYVELHEINTALFWYDKLITLSGGEEQDVYWYANALYKSAQYHRAIKLLDRYRISERFAAGKYLKARCHFDSKEYEDATNVLVDFESDEDKKLEKTFEVCEGIPHLDASLESSIMLLKAQICEILENREFALKYYKKALKLDVKCYEAFRHLIQNQLLSAEEEKKLMQQLKYDNCASAQEKEMVKFLYESLLKKLDKPQNIIPPQMACFKNNIDILIARAETYFYNCDFDTCYIITKNVILNDAYNLTCLPLHIGVLIELKKNNELFFLGHQLINLYPKKEISWYCVAAYYFLNGKQDPVRKYISKATSLNRMFGHAWLLYGHSFGVENEHDQAMAAYFTASKVMEGCHLPLLYIGLEYGLTNNAKLAEKFFKEALVIAPDDPFVLHELGIVAFQNQQYQAAEEHFLNAVKKFDSINGNLRSEKWEPFFNNLGHVCRKLKKYDESISYHLEALAIIPNNASTYSALGYTHALNGNYHEAIECFHKSLGLRKDDSFTTSMLNVVIEQLISEEKPYPEMSDVLPESSLTDLKLKDFDPSAANSLDISYLPTRESSSDCEFENSNSLLVVQTPHDFSMIQDEEMEDA